MTQRFRLHPTALAVLAATLAGAAFSGSALAAIPFTGAQYEASAIAEGAGAAPEVDLQSAADFITASAASVGGANRATAGAIAGPGLLTTSADVSAGELSHAVATARFSGSFVHSGTVSLSLDYSGLNFADGTGAASTTLFVSLVNGGVTLFEDYVQGPWSFSYTPAAGSTSLLDLTLTSEASSAFLSAGTGNASSFGSVAIMGAVPEASTWLMFAFGLAGMAVVSRRRKAVDGGRL